MPLFSSRRERNLWLWTLTIMVAIFTSLGFARSLAETLRNQNLLGVFFIFGFLLMISTIVLQGLNRRPGGLELGMILGITSAYLLTFVRIAIPEERTHLIEYSVLAVFLYEALRERKQNGRTVASPAILAALATALLGYLDEGIQAILPNRFFDYRDVGFNALAGIMAICASLLLSWARRKSP